MRISTFLISTILMLLLGCHKSQESEIYYWRAVYNPENYDGDYEVKTEVDTISNKTNLETDSTSRSHLYRESKAISHLIDSLSHEKVFIDKESVEIEKSTFSNLTMAIDIDRYEGVSDSLFVLMTQASTHYYHPEYGLIKITYPHSSHPGKIFSYELKKIISRKNGEKDTLEIAPLIESIRKENLKDMNKRMNELGEDVEIKEWY